MKVYANRPPKPPDTPGTCRALEQESPEMTEYNPRLFDCDADIRRIGEGLLARTLPKVDWTHEAHLAACTWIVRDREDVVPERDMSTIISGYNESVGGVNSDIEGYHETITQVFIAAVRDHLDEVGREVPLVEAVNTLLLSERGRREWPLRFYTPERLFSVEARRVFVSPDTSALDSG